MEASGAPRAGNTRCRARVARARVRTRVRTSWHLGEAPPVGGPVRRAPRDTQVCGCEGAAWTPSSVQGGTPRGSDKQVAKIKRATGRKSQATGSKIGATF